MHVHICIAGKGRWGCAKASTIAEGEQRWAREKSFRALVRKLAALSLFSTPLSFSLSSGRSTRVRFRPCVCWFPSRRSRPPPRHTSPRHWGNAPPVWRHEPPTRSVIDQLVPLRREPLTRLTTTICSPPAPPRRDPSWSLAIYRGSVSLLARFPLAVHVQGTYIDISCRTFYAQSCVTFFFRYQYFIYLNNINFYNEISTSKLLFIQFSCRILYSIFTQKLVYSYLLCGKLTTEILSTEVVACRTHFVRIRYCTTNFNFLIKNWILVKELSTNCRLFIASQQFFFHLF